MNNRYFINIGFANEELSAQESPIESIHWGRYIDEYGFLIENPYNSELIDLSQIKRLSAAIIVAEAGMGKTYILKEIKNSIPNNELRFLEPCLYAKNLQAFEEIFTQKLNEQYVLVDGLDENEDTIQILIRKIHQLSQGKHIILTSRNIPKLRLLQERLNFPMYVLLPLSEDAIYQMAKDEKIDGNQFVRTVKQKGLSSICANPLGCKHLMNLFKAGRLVNTTYEQLWESAVLELCSDNNTDTYDLKEEDIIATPQNCYDIASKIAIILKLAGKSIIQRICTTKTEEDSIDFSRFFTREEWPIFNAILHRTLFTPINNNCFRFSHKTYFDFFAAIGLQKYVPKRSWKSIVCSPENDNIYPQWEDAVAWLATSSNECAEHLLDKQPELLLSSETLINTIGSSKLCSSLLKRSKELDYWAIHKTSLCKKLHLLKTPDVIPLVRASLDKARSISEREMAISIIQDFSDKELENVLVAIYCDSTEEHSLRLSAGYSLKEYASREARLKCKVILEDNRCSSDLKGLLFQMTWPNLISIKDIWPHLCNYNKHNLDSFWTWVEFDYPNSLPQIPQETLFEILNWFTDNLSINTAQDALLKMFRQTLSICWNRYGSLEQLTLIGKVIIQLGSIYIYPFFEKSFHDVPKEICCSPNEFYSSIEKRHKLADTLMDISTISGHELTNPSCAILDSNDIPFIFDRILISSEDSIRYKWGNCLKSIRGLIPLPEQKDNWDKVFELYPRVLEKDALHTIEERNLEKQKWQKYKEECQTRLNAREQRVLVGFQNKCKLIKQFLSDGRAEKYFIFITNEIIEATPAHSFDYQASGIWKGLTETERHQLTIIAEKYIQNTEDIDSKEESLHFTSTLALLLLINNTPGVLRMFSSTVIKEHTKELFDNIEFDSNHGFLLPLLNDIVTFFPSVFQENLLNWINKRLSEGVFPNLDKYSKHITQELINQILEITECDKCSDALMFLVLNELRKFAPKQIQDYILKTYATLSDDIKTWGHRLTIFVLEYMPDKISILVHTMRENPTWGKEWLEDVIHVNCSQYKLVSLFSHASAQTLSDFYIWLNQNYPAVNKPQHDCAYTPKTDELIYSFIMEVFNSILSVC